MSRQTEADDVRAAMQALYDRYYQSRAYRQRYPRPNASTLACVLDAIGGQPLQVLDVGCGNGRYALELLHRTPVHLTANDISAQALAELQERLDHIPQLQPRIRLVQGPVDTVQGTSFDLVLLLFGVLSHVGRRPARVALLRTLAAASHGKTRLVLSVPSIWRRRPWELLRSLWSRRAAANGHVHAGAGADAYAHVTEGVAELGDVHFQRFIDGQRVEFFYHLYSLRQLRAELAEAGWQLVQAEAESLLPEWLISQHPVLERCDGWVQKLLPAFWAMASALSRCGARRNHTRRAMRGFLSRAGASRAGAWRLIAACWAFVCVAVLCLLAQQALAQEPPADVRTSSTLAAIRQKGTLVVGVKTDYPPFGMLDAQGQGIGFEHDLAADIARRLGVRLVKVSVTGANRLQKLEEGSVDLVVATTGDTAERRRIATLIEPNYYASGVTLFTPPDPKIRDWVDIRGKKVCVAQGSYFNRTMGQRYLLDLVTFNTPRDARLGVRDGRCVGFLFDNTAIAADLKQPQWAGYQAPLPPVMSVPWSMAIARKEAGTDWERWLGDVVADWHRNGYLREREAAWGLAPAKFLQDTQALWLARDAAGAFVCQRQGNGQWPGPCRNPALLGAQDVGACTGWACGCATNGAGT